MVKRLDVFATVQDWIELLQLASAPSCFDLYKISSVEGPIRAIEVGALESGSYLMLPSGVLAILRAVESGSKGVWQVLDQVANPDSLVLHTGVQTCDGRLTAGSIGTAGTAALAPWATSLLQAIKGRTIGIKSYRLGPAARALLAAGVRLSPTAKSPPMYDLRN